MATDFTLPATTSKPHSLKRIGTWVFMAFGALLCFWLFVLPVIVVALSSVASHWSGTIFPDGFSMRWFERLGSSDFDALTTSLEVGFGVAVLGTVLGLWLALALEGRDRRGVGAWVDTIAMMPNGVPSVVLGLSVLIAYHKKPLGFATVPIVVVGQVNRGYYLPASALSLILLVVSLAALLLIAAKVPRRRMT
jgi:2-aminoethylphosphonate transport system permease protein